MASDDLVKPSSYALFHILSKGNNLQDLETVLDVWEELAVTRLQVGTNGGYTYDGLGYDVDEDDDEEVYPVHIVAANCGDLQMFQVGRSIALSMSSACSDVCVVFMLSCCTLS